MSNTIEQNSKVEWKDVNWRKAEKAVFKLQKRIYQVSASGSMSAVEKTKKLRKLQKTLMRSWSARLIAVKRVTQDNQGKVTAGVDGVKNLKHLPNTQKADKILAKIRCLSRRNL